MFETGQVRIKKGKLAAEQPADSCMLPVVLRISAASQQADGAMRTRDLDSAEPVVAHDQLPAGTLAELAPFEKAAVRSNDDPSPLVGMATVLERAGFLANAYEVYSKVQAKWPGVVWVKFKLEELDQLMAAKAKAPKAHR